MHTTLAKRIEETAPAKDLLRFITCGSVDDGKSTLIGRLLHDSKLILDDQLSSLVKDSARHGTTGDDIDFALLVDGLEAEREQGITIDVAYRFFATSKRSFIVADTPGHEQYTRNMATGASNAQLAVILIDARKGVLVQTRRHSLICALLGIRHVLVAVNKIDLVGFDRDTFERIAGEYASFATQLGFTSIVPIPISARFGDNITEPSLSTPWTALPGARRRPSRRGQPSRRGSTRLSGSSRFGLRWPGACEYRRRSCPPCSGSVSCPLRASPGGLFGKPLVPILDFLGRQLGNGGRTERRQDLRLCGLACVNK